MKKIWDKDTLSLYEYTGKEAEALYYEIATLYFEVFSTFPYLYSITDDYDRGYFNHYFNSEESRFLILFDQKTIVGFSTSIPLRDHVKEIQGPFIRNNKQTSEYLYIGEVALKKAYRGYGIGRKFLEYQEQRGSSLPNIKHMCLMAIDRPEDHPNKPDNYQPLDSLWEYFGYQRMPNGSFTFPWKHSNDGIIRENLLAMWTKKIN